MLLETNAFVIEEEIFASTIFSTVRHTRGIFIWIMVRKHLIDNYTALTTVCKPSMERALHFKMYTLE